MKKTTLLASLLCIAALGGCYERTTSSRGVGSDTVSVQKPYRSETALDRWWDDLWSWTEPAPKRTVPHPD